jgi:putative transposase
MPRRPRSAVPATFHHVMNRSSRSTTLFSRPREYVGFIRVLREALARHDVELLTYCVMPNHWHLVLRTDQIRELSRFMHWLSTTHARRWHRVRGTVGLGPVYKGRFLSVPIEADGSLIRVCRYVERNPLRAGLVRRAEEWPWSSLTDRGRRKRRLLVLTAPFLEGPTWVDHVNTPLASSELVAMDRFLDTEPTTLPPNLVSPVP